MKTLGINIKYFLCQNQEQLGVGGEKCEARFGFFLLFLSKKVAPRANFFYFILKYQN